MWFTSIMTTGAGFTTLGMGVAGGSYWENLLDRRRIQHGAVILAVGAALAFCSALAEGVSAAELQRLALQEVTLMLLAGLAVLRFGTDNTLKTISDQNEVRTRPSKRARESARRKATAARKAGLPYYPEDDEPTVVVAFNNAQEQAARAAMRAQPAPKRKPAYQAKRED